MVHYKTRIRIWARHAGAGHGGGCVQVDDIRGIDMHDDIPTGEEN